jgi:hypothetical protein
MVQNLQPDGIIITISAKMLKEKGYRNWLRNFLHAMRQEDCTYWMRQGAAPKHDILYVYLCIGGKVRFRANFAGTESGHKTFDGGKKMYARVWIVLCGPLERPPRKQEPILKGFRGFRYTQKLF